MLRPIFCVKVISVKRVNVYFMQHPLWKKTVKYYLLIVPVIDQCNYLWPRCQTDPENDVWLLHISHNNGQSAWLILLCLTCLISKQCLVYLYIPILIMFGFCLKKKFWYIGRHNILFKVVMMRRLLIYKKLKKWYQTFISRKSFIVYVARTIQ